MPPAALQFGSFVLDLDRLSLRGPAGEAELRPKCFEVLRHLVNHAGRLVTKDALMGAVWPDVTVTDDSLTRCISEVRRALGDEGQKLLKTVSRRGYMLDAHVTPLSGMSPTPASEPTTAPDRPVVAVLPLVNLSGGSADDYFCDGMTEDIITELSRFSELGVIARHSSFQFRGKTGDIRVVGRELGAHYILEGGLQRGRDRVRITARLLDTTTGSQRWAERYDREIEDLFAVQDELVCAIASVLLAHIRRAEVKRTLLKPPVTWQAYDHFVRGLDLHLAYQSSQDLGSLHGARQCFEEALALDPAYARPRSALAISHLSTWTNYGEPEFLQNDALVRAYEFARDAVRLEPQQAYGQAILAWVLTWRRYHDLALQALERAMALNASYSHWQIAGTLMFAGESDRALHAMQNYMQLDPFHPTSPIGWLGVNYWARGQLAEAKRYLHEAVTRSPRRVMFHYWLTAAISDLGEAQAAAAGAQNILALQPNFTISAVARPLAVFRSAHTEARFLEALRNAGLPE